MSIIGLLLIYALGFAAVIFFGTILACIVTPQKRPEDDDHD
jgi:hypothetical protein